MCSLILSKTPGFPNPICSAVAARSLPFIFFILCLSPLALHPGMTSSQALYLSARCLRAEHDSGNYPSALLLPEQFSCVLAVFSELQMKEAWRDALGVWDQHAA